MTEYFYHREPSPHLIMRNVFDDHQLLDIKKEIEILKHGFVTDTHYLESAKTLDGEPLRTGSGVFLSKICSNISSSPSMRYCAEKFRTYFFSHYLKDDWVRLLYTTTQKGSFLINRYGVGDEYKKHHDNTIFTMVICFKEFCVGGNFFLNNEENIIDLNDNDGILFIGTEYHGVTPVIEGERYSLTSFIRK